MKKLEAEKDELARKWEAGKLEAAQELEAVQTRVLLAQGQAESSKEDSIDAERIMADAVRALDEQTQLTEEARKEVAALHQELAATKERLRELSLHQSQGENLQVPVDMSDEYQTQEGSDDSDMETDATEAAEKGNEQEERARRLAEEGRISNEDSGEEQKKASAGGKGKRSQQSGRVAKPAAKKKQEKQAAAPAMTTRAKVKQERTKSRLGKAAENEESWNFIPISNGKRSPEKLRDKEEAKAQGSGNRFAGSPKFIRGEGQ